MTNFKSKTMITSAIILSSAIFLAACSSYAWPGRGSAKAAAQEGAAPARADTMPMMAGMDMDAMSLDGLTDEEVRTKCMAMHQEMMKKMSEGGMMSGGHDHMDGKQHEGGMMMSPEMKAVHERCMAAMPEMQAKHDRCMAMKADGDGMMSEDQMHEMHQNCMKMDDAATGDVPATPHSHEHMPNDGGS